MCVTCLSQLCIKCLTLCIILKCRQSRCLHLVAFIYRQTLFHPVWQNEHNINLYKCTLSQQESWVEGRSCSEWHGRFDNDEKETKNEEEEAKRRGETVGGEQAMLRWAEQPAWSRRAPFQKRHRRERQNQQTQLRYACVDLHACTVHLENTPTFALCNEMGDLVSLANKNVQYFLWILSRDICWNSLHHSLSAFHLSDQS